MVKLKGQFGRRLLVLTPFLLIALGGVCIVQSPWPEILRASLHGAHIAYVRPTWHTVGLPILAAASWGVAVWLSLQIKPRETRK